VIIDADTHLIDCRTTSPAGCIGDACVVGHAARPEPVSAVLLTGSEITAEEAKQPGSVTWPRPRSNASPPKDRRTENGRRERNRAPAG
jgi:hypothetical protein